MTEPPAVYSEKYPKARKEHRCCECNRIIKPGEKYQQLKSDGYESIVFVEVIMDLREIERMRDREE